MLSLRLPAAMNAGNDPAAWQNFYIMIGTANAAITGLLFVALSLHLKEILAHAVYKPRAIVVLVTLNLFFLALNVRYRTPARITAGSALTIAIRVIYVLAAVSLITGVGGGFYILGGILTLTVARSISNCWTLLTALESDSAA